MPIDYTKRPAQPSGSAAPVSLSKVTLTKSSPTVSLSKAGGGATGTLRVNLNWNARPAGASGGGLFKKLAGQSTAIDLDLGCLYELADGTKGVVQALGNSFSSRNTGNPIISLDGDDRSGTNTAGENLSVDLSRLDEIRKILVFAFIYEGVPNWAGADGVVTLFPAAGAPIEMRLDESDPKAAICAIAVLENVGNELSIRREVQYIRGGQGELDRSYGWGMKWKAGRK